MTVEKAPTVSTGNQTGEKQPGAERPWYKDPNWFIFITGALYAIVATGQLRAIRRQANIADDQLAEMRWQAAIARNALVLAHRPKLIVRNVVLRYPRLIPGPQPRDWFWPGEYVAGQLYIANVGGTPGQIVECGCWVHWQKGEYRKGLPLSGTAKTMRDVLHEMQTDGGRWENDLPMERPYEGRRGNVGKYGGPIAPGASIPLPFQSERPMGDEGHHIRDGFEGWSLWLLGFVFYSDESDPPITRTTAFCREWAPGYRRFVTIDDPDYEHAD